jgi:hypothetical protein
MHGVCQTRDDVRSWLQNAENTWLILVLEKFGDAVKTRPRRSDDDDISSRDEVKSRTGF